MRGSVLLWSCGGALHATYVRVRSDLDLRHVHQSIIFNVFLFSNLHDVDVVNFVYLHHLPLRLYQDFHYFPAVFLVCCELTGVREIAAFLFIFTEQRRQKNDSFHVSVSARSQVLPVGVLFLLDEQVSTHFQLLADKRLQEETPHPCRLCPC